jgi:hypothetical protein
MDSICMFLMVDLIGFVRDMVVGERKTLDFSSRHQAQTLVVGPIAVDGAVLTVPPNTPP